MLYFFKEHDGNDTVETISGREKSMPFFQWKDSFNIGNAEIDRQHRSFLEMLNEYYDSGSGSTKDHISGQLVVRIKEYAAMHFHFEEQLMRESGYEELERQLKQHRYFESLVSDLESDHQEGRTDDFKRVLPLLKDWFLRHILEEDKKYVSHLKPPRHGKP
jgi:hemerythrin-like metal-binding protein